MEIMEGKKQWNWIQTETISNKWHNYYEEEKTNPYDFWIQYLKYIPSV